MPIRRASDAPFLHTVLVDIVTDQELLEYYTGLPPTVPLCVSAPPRAITA